MCSTKARQKRQQTTPEPQDIPRLCTDVASAARAGETRRLCCRRSCKTATRQKSPAKTAGESFPPTAAGGWSGLPAQQWPLTECESAGELPPKSEKNICPAPRHRARALHSL